MPWSCHGQALYRRRHAWLQIELRRRAALCSTGSSARVPTRIIGRALRGRSRNHPLKTNEHSPFRCLRAACFPSAVRGLIPSSLNISEHSRPLGGGALLTRFGIALVYIALPEHRHLISGMGGRCRQDHSNQDRNGSHFASSSRRHIIAFANRKKLPSNFSKSSWLTAERRSAHALRRDGGSISGDVTV
jgi:hypothetical protein